MRGKEIISGSLSAFVVVFVVAIIGWFLFFFSNITGQSLLQFDPPVDLNPGIDKDFEVFPDKKPGLSPVESSIAGCNTAKEIRSFICDVFQDQYGGKCGVFSGKCKGVRDLCLLAQENVDEECSFPDEE